jgi:formamidopyrimidine-DNA glycosylase
MPELPEVETTRSGLIPHMVGRKITRVLVRDGRLRWPVPSDFASLITGLTVTDITRRGKYLLWNCRDVKADVITGEHSNRGGFVLSHLGMSGTLRALVASDAAQENARKHDHIDVDLESGTTIRFTDPRRFGAMLWIAGGTGNRPSDVPSHPLLDVLGPEPLSDQFSAQHLFERSRGRSVSIKEFIMNGHIVVGVGNIYASESLFRAGIHPARAAGKVSLKRYELLVGAIRETLSKAIAAGGSSLRDYVQTNGDMGYFQIDAFVYGRTGKACRGCKEPIRQIVQGQRSTYYCGRCQR